MKPSTRSLVRRALLLPGLMLMCTTASATLGVFEHGNGINSMGMGGVTYNDSRNVRIDQDAYGAFLSYQVFAY